VNNQRVGIRALQNRVAASGQVIGRLGRREREGVGRVEVVLILLPARDVSVGETVIEPRLAGPRDMRQDAVEDFIPISE
jgi:hypothetical protein